MHVPKDWIEVCPYLKNLAEHHCNEALTMDALHFVAEALKDKLIQTDTDGISRFLCWSLDTSRSPNLTHEQCIDWMHLADYLLMEPAYRVLVDRLTRIHLPQMIFSLT